MISRRGFTLIELMMGLLIFSIIAGTVYSIFAGGVRLSRISEGRVAVYREASWAFTLMAREFENMVRYDVSGIKEMEEIFIGEKDRIAFLLPTDSGLKYIKYYLLAPTSEKIHQVVLGQKTSRNMDVNITSTVSARSYFLVREEYGIKDILSGQANDKKPEIITGNIIENSLHLEYGYADGELSNKIRYEDTWRQEDIPSRIRISMVLIDDYDEEKVALSRDILIPQGILGKLEI